MNVPLLQPEDGVLPASILPRVGRHCPQLTHLSISGCTLDLQLLQPLTKGTPDPGSIPAPALPFAGHRGVSGGPISLTSLLFASMELPALVFLSPAADFVRSRTATVLAAESAAAAVAAAAGTATVVLGVRLLRYSCNLRCCCWYCTVLISPLDDPLISCCKLQTLNTGTVQLLTGTLSSVDPLVISG
jgi:hypothetical protein